jgi:hypothetical protein
VSGYGCVDRSLLKQLQTVKIPLNTIIRKDSLIRRSDSLRMGDIQETFYNVFQLPEGTPLTPMQASQARWVRVRTSMKLNDSHSALRITLEFSTT